MFLKSQTVHQIGLGTEPIPDGLWVELASYPAHYASDLSGPLAVTRIVHEVIQKGIFVFKPSVEDFWTTCKLNGLS